MIRGLQDTVADAAYKAMRMAVEKLYWEKRDGGWEIVNMIPSGWTRFADEQDYRDVKCRLVQSGNDRAGNITRIDVHLRNEDETWHLEAIYRREEDDCPFMFYQDDFFRHAIVLEMSSGIVSYAAALGDTAAAVRWLTYWKMLQPSDDCEE